MLDSIGILLGVLLSILGLVEVCRVITLWILRTKEENDAMMIVPIRGHNEEAELLLRSAAARAKWTGGSRLQRVICLDCGMDEETRVVCETLSQDFTFIELRTPPEMEQMLAGEVCAAER